MFRIQLLFEHCLLHMCLVAFILEGCKDKVVRESNLRISRNACVEQCVGSDRAPLKGESEGARQISSAKEYL